jgi:ABC-type nitrate/sulfonate/bicarbonate transport system ATPase subunit
MLEIEINRKSYPDRGGQVHIALAGLSLCVQRGELVCVVGPSGCGKSTLLNVVGGLDTDVDGAVKMGGAVPQLGIGFMFQEPRLMPWLTVLDNVRLVAGNSDAAKARAGELLTAMELGDVMNAFPGSLSGGMQRRVALARAFVIDPVLLLMDEPFVSLDAPTATRLRNMLLNLWQRCNTTVLFVTHDLREALSLADRVCFLSGAPGQLVLDLPIDLPRPRSADDPRILALQTNLLQQHPELLAGLASSKSAEEASA